MSNLSHLFTKGSIFHSYRLKNIQMKHIGNKKYSYIMNWNCKSDNNIPVSEFIDILDCHISFCVPKQCFNIMEYTNDKRSIQIYAVSTMLD